MINTGKHDLFSSACMFSTTSEHSGSVRRCTLCKSLWIRASAKRLQCKCKMTGPGDLRALDVCSRFPWSSGLSFIKEEEKRKIYLCRRGETWIEGFGLTKVCLTGWRAGTVSERTPWWLTNRYERRIYDIGNIAGFNTGCAEFAEYSHYITNPNWRFLYCNVTL